MLILGTMEWASTIERGEFVCPSCESTKSFQRKVSRPFLTLYFVPVIPIGVRREFVVCRACRSRFDNSVLEDYAAASTWQSNDEMLRLPFEGELLRAIALMIMEDDLVTPAEMEMGQRVYQNMLQRPLAQADLESACREVVSLRIKAARYLARASDSLTYDQKVMMLQAMFAVASAEGQISARRMHSLIEAQQQLQLDEVAFQTAVKNASSWI